jgi:hypothetical protein
VSPRRGLAFLLGLGILASGSSSSLSGATFTAKSANRANAIAAAADWVAPVVGVTAPAGVVRATATIAATASDAGSGVATVRLQRSPAGAASWTDICTDATAPFGCTLDSTTLADGRYDLRAIAVDKAGNSATSAVVANVLVDNTAPDVTLADPGAYLKGTLTLTANAGDGTGAGVTAVVIQRAPADTTTWTDICTDPVAPYSCSLNTTTLANDAYDLRAVATDGAGNTTASDIVSVEVDNLAPTVTLTDPGATLSGTVTLATTPADTDSGVAGVTVQRSPTGLNTWTDVCSSAAAPWTCRFTTTTVSDGLYDLRAIAVDAAGNTKTSATISARRVDNTTVSTISLDDPGAFLRGTVTLSANANALGGVASVRIQRAKAGTTTWTDVCTDSTPPYACAFDTTTAATPDGTYDLRAIMTSNLGVVTTSATVANRTIDNTAVRGSDVQAINKTGGTLGRVEAGDKIVLTYSELMKASTLIPGWTGTSAATVYVRLVDIGGVESIGLTANPAGTSATGLGSIAPSGNYIRSNKTATFTSTAVLTTATGGGSVVTITLGTLSGNATRTYNTAVAVKWTPSATATDLAGNPCSAAVVTETGTLDRDF